jgi:hypothetical protein
MASMEVIDLLEQRLLAAAQNDPMAKIASGEIDTETKQQKLLDTYAEELLSNIPSGRICKCRWLRGPERTETCKFAGLDWTKPMPHSEIDVWNPGS